MKLLRHESINISDIIFEAPSKIKKIIAYHGSPYKFDKFNDDTKGKSGQLGSELGFWFTTDKKIATRFAMVYPDDMYDLIKKKRESLTEKYRKLKLNLLKLVDIKKLIDELKDEKAVRILKNDLNNPEKFLNSIIIYVNYFGRKNIDKNTQLSNFVNKLIELDNKDEQISKLSDSKIKDWYDKNHKGYLYTVELNIGKHAVENGEDIGTNWDRYNTIEQYDLEGFDSVTIKFADTGQGLGDEIIVFDTKNIKIKKVEEV